MRRSYVFVGALGWVKFAEFSFEFLEIPLHRRASPRAITPTAPMAEKARDAGIAALLLPVGIGLTEIMRERR
jgi:hypothetical protein